MLQYQYFDELSIVLGSIKLLLIDVMLPVNISEYFTRSRASKKGVKYGSREFRALRVSEMNLRVTLFQLHDDSI